MPESNPAREMQQRYKNVFGTEQGRKVLGDILTMGHFGETLSHDDPKRVIEYSFAMTIARMAGALDPIYPQLGISVKGETIDDGS